jgi:hypothetical protein
MIRDDGELPVARESISNDDPAWFRHAGPMTRSGRKDFLSVLGRGGRYL